MVTGVQTCALPICRVSSADPSRAPVAKPPHPAIKLNPVIGNQRLFNMSEEDRPATSAALGRDYTAIKGTRNWPERCLSGQLQKRIQKLYL